MSKKIEFCILAAGKGSRLKLGLSKALLDVRGKKSLDYTMSEIKKFMTKTACSCETSFVLAYQKKEVESYLLKHYPKVLSVEQKEINGTAGAVRSFLEEKKPSGDYVIVSCVDTPNLKAEIFETLLTHLEKGLDAVVASFKTPDPFGLGRIERREDGFRIVEEKEASKKQKEIKEVNSGVYIFKTSYLKEQIEKIDNKNASGEFYLTDLFLPGNKTEAICFDEANTFIGVNTLKDLNEVCRVMNKKKIDECLENGVRIMDPARTYIEDDVYIEAGVTIYPDVYLLGDTRVQSGCVIEPNVWLKDVHLENGVQVKGFSHLERALVKARASIGPFARLRPGTEIGEEAKIGNFVEIKKSVLEKGVKASHLTYIGDAQIGENTNIGCGVITVNYDGANKHKTKIGKNSFVGSDCQLVAPVSLGDETFVACGSTITSDLESGDFAIARQKQVTKKGLAKRFLK